MIKEIKKNTRIKKMAVSKPKAKASSKNGTPNNTRYFNDSEDGYMNDPTSAVIVSFTSVNGKPWEIKEASEKQYPDIHQGILAYMQYLANYQLELEGVDSKKDILVGDTQGRKWVNAPVRVWRMLLESAELIKEIEDKYYQATGGKSVWRHPKATVTVKRKTKKIAIPVAPVVNTDEDDEDWEIEGDETPRTDEDLLTNDLNDVFG